MVQHCCLSTCKNSRHNTKNVSYHRFPKREKLQKEWAKRCKSNNKINFNVSRLCSAHFLADDFERDLQHELLNLPLKKMLKSDAVPSQNLPYWPSEKSCTQQVSLNKLYT